MDSLFIDKYITVNRIKPYLRRTNGNNNIRRALTLYEVNLEYSAQLYKLLSILETSLRNLVNGKCIELFGYDWITNIRYDIHLGILDSFSRTNKSTKKTLDVLDKIFSIQESIVKDTIDKLKEDNKPITNDNLVSGLVFGFWTRLFNKTYESILWNKSLSIIFNKQLSRNKVEDILNEFRWLRNRIAHSECIINMKHSLQKYYNKILSFLEIIDPKLESWARKRINIELFE